MKNLRITQYDQWKTLDAHHITAIAWDVASSSLFCTLRPSQNDTVIQLVRIDLKSKPFNHEIITSWNTLCPSPNLSHDEVINLHYLADKSMSCLILAGGDIIVVAKESFVDEETIELVGAIDKGITCARWSPDEELIAVTTKVNTLIFMSRNFETIVHVTMNIEDLKISKQVSVGWGKKETQFRGRGIRPLRDPTMPEKIDEGILSPNDDFKVYLSWRGDGAYVAISSIEAQKRRVIRVYSREGKLDSVSEPIDGLEGTISWRPSGNLIASIQRLKDHVKVVFFERNGLRHGEFSLRLTTEQYQYFNQHIQLQWSSDSNLLAVVMEKHIELWTMNNYHWYLKQQISYNDSSSAFSFSWHPEKPLQCMFATKESITVIELIFMTVNSGTISPNDYGTVAVTDGMTIKLTPFRVANIPPPMSLHEIEVITNVIDISLNDVIYSIAVLHQTGISVFNWENVADQSTCPLLTREISLQRNQDSGIKYQQISWNGDNEVATLHCLDSMSYVTIFNFDMEIGKKEIIEIIDVTSSLQLSNITTLSNFSDGKNVYAFAQSKIGDIQSLQRGERAPVHFKVPLNLPWIQLITFEDYKFAIGMSSNGFLYVNNLLLARNCTSFLTTHAYIIFTTTSNLLKLVHINDIENLEMPSDNVGPDEMCRYIERGARLVIAVPTNSSLILQMPRGNIETIYPRVMVLAGIRKLIEKKNYKKAFARCRTHKVDVNLLYDYNPKQFLSNIELIMKQLEKTSYIDLFLSSLREEDVTKTLYKEVKYLKTSDSKITFSNKVGTNLLASEKSFKVNEVLDACLRVFENNTAENFQNIITAHVCKSPPALDDGLHVIASLRKDSPHLVEKAVEHICFLTDVNKLYNHALGLYDIDLALVVVQNSQKDPREYLPFMQSLQKMTSLRRQFIIDDHLGRYTKALSGLHQLGAFLEFQTYTEKHSLYSAALSLYRYDDTHYDIITSMYAKYLESKSEFYSAALAYEALSDYVNATKCYLDSGPCYWRNTLYCALSQSPPFSESAFTELATTLYDALIESKDYYSAATIQSEYLSSVSTACQDFCKGYFFNEALHLCRFKEQPEIIQSIIEPGLIECLASSMQFLADCKAQILAQVPRIRELRQKAIDDPLAFYEGDRVGVDSGIPDDVSIVASSSLTNNGSLFTRYTDNDRGTTVGTMVSKATSKHKKKEEKKRAKGKKGSIYEEEYLVNSVERLIKRVETARGDVDKLIKGLLRRRMWEQARALEVTLENLVKLCADIVTEVFNPETIALENNQDQYGQVGGATVLQESREALRNRKNVPVIAAFKKLNLLY